MSSWLISLILGLVISSSSSFAETISFPDEELATESVLPKFDRVEVVKNRNVTTAKRIEFSPFVGFVSTEPIYSQSKVGFNLGYHWSETSAAVLNFSKFSGGLNTQYTDQLSKDYSLDFNRAPKQTYAAYLNYEYKVFYGKISLTKQGTMSLSTYPILGLGLNAYETKSYPGAHAGLGQKFYFSNNFGLRADLLLQYAQAPSPFLQGKMRSTDAVPDKGEFVDKWSMQTIIDLGVSFLF